LSLNEYCVRRVAAPGTALAVDEGASSLVAAAARIVGPPLLGVIVYGSWARGEATPTSDVDVLVVVEPEVPLTRSLYRAWDRTPVRWLGRQVDPHFAYLPAGRIVGGAWGEVAVDGLVLFERDLRISAALAQARRDIAAGRLVRRIVHGQPYWTVAA
jgi:hypothetical protein